MLLRLHTMGGIFVAPLLLVAALSGLGYALAPTIEQIVYRHEITVPEASRTLPARPLGEQIEAARRTEPDLALAGVIDDDDPATATRVLFSDPSLPSKSYRRAVFVDPATLNITGKEVQYGSARALPLRAWISEGHSNVWLGDPGRLYSEAAASWLGALTVGGLLLWWQRARRTRPGRLGRVVGIGLTPTTKGTRARHRTRHAVIGTWCAAGFLFLTVTGLTWSLVAGEGIATLRSEANWTRPSLSATESSQPSAASVAPMSAETVDAQAQRVEDSARAEGLDRMLMLTPPSDGDGSWTVEEQRQSWRFARDAVAIDGSDGTVVERLPFGAWPFMAQATDWLIQLHMGTLLGLPNQLVLAALALGLMVVIVHGYAMWFLRSRRTATGRRAVRLPGPVGWQDLPTPALVGIAMAVIAYGILAPVFGATLVAFLIIDAAIQAVQHRRRAMSTRESTKRKNSTTVSVS